MKREIKFRAWDKESKQMVYRDLETFAKFGCPLIPMQEAIENGKIMQYTNLKDSKGVEIYEGDIVKFPVLGEVKNRIGFIRYVNENGAFIIFDSCAWEDFNLLAQHKKAHTMSQSYAYKIIGNIYENPELLKEKLNE